MKGLNEDVLEFCNSTTCHGMSQIVNENYNGKLRALMVLVLLASLSVTGWSITKSVIQFYKYPYYQTVTKNYTGDKPFPSVSICNMVPMTAENLEIGLAGIFAQYPIPYHKWDPPTKYWSFPLYYENQQGGVETAWKYRDLVMDCNFKNKPCNSSTNSEFFNFYYGRCFTFNLDDESLKRSGDKNGLLLNLYAYSSVLSTDMQISRRSLSYSSNADMNSVGMKLIVHNKGDFVHPFENVIQIAPGNAYSISMHPIKTTRLEQPYHSNCTRRSFVKGTQYRYSKKTCLYFCKQAFVVNACGCKDSDYPLVKYPQTPFCGNFSAAQHGPFNFSAWVEKVDCMINEGEQFESMDKSSCGCQEPCVEYSYKLTQSAAHWPSNYVQTGFYESKVLTKPGSQAHKDLSNHTLKHIIENDLIRKNFLQVKVFFNSDEVDDVTEFATYSEGVWSLLSELGGYLGFWCGISVVTITDAIFFVVRILTARKKNDIAPDDGKTFG